MRNVYHLLLGVCLLATINTGFATTPPDPYELSFIKNRKEQLNYTKQLQIRNGAAWSKFKARHSQWNVIFDERTGMPHRSYGEGIKINGTGGDKEKALAFIQTELPSFGLPLNDLVFRGSHTSKYKYVDFYQTYQGIEVLSSRVTVRMTNDDRVILFGVDVFKDIKISIQPQLSAEMVKSLAASGISYLINDVTVNSEVKILPVPVNDKFEYRLVYEAKVFATNADGYPARYYTLVDGNSGEVLYRQNEICQLNADVTTEATVSDPNPWEPTVVHNLPYLKINVNGTDYFTDQNGHVEVPGVTSPTSATIYLQGTWSTVVTGNSSNAVSNFTTTIDAGSNTVSFDGHATLEQLSAYYHATIMHDYMKSYLPSFTGMDESLETRVERTDGSCNAYYDGSSINFYKQSDGCFDLALCNDVVYHEYSHGTDMRFYDQFSNGLSNGAMNEGYSDVWAISVTDNPILGIGFSDTDPNEYVRRYDINKKVYPQDIMGESHADGEIICGAWYDTRLNIGSVSAMMDIFSEALFGVADGFDGTEGLVFTDVLIDALTADDDDANIANGTPNDIAIISAFALHGIILIGDIVITHAEPLQSIAEQPILIQANLSTNYPFYMGDPYLHYKADLSSSYDSVIMTLVSGTTYEATIPSQNSGTIIDYYFSVTDIYGNLAPTKPLLAVGLDPNIPYKLLCGFVKTATEDFDNFAGAWVFSDPSDDAETGQWTIDSPVPSYIVPGNATTMVQTNLDHTANSTSNYCIFTGNTSSPNDGAGTNDVDHGKNTLYSPKFDLTNYKIPAISYYRWFSNDQGANPGNDPWRVYISNDQNTWIPIENTHTADHSWRNMAFRVGDFVTPNATVQLMFVASDSVLGSVDLEGQSLVEAAIDDVYLWDEGENVGIEEVGSDFSFNVFPNPASDFVQVQMENQLHNHFKVELMNGLGQTIWIIDDFEDESFVIPVSDLVNGIYMIRIQNGSETSVSRMTVQH